jgi:hypothetical protein
MLDSVFSVVLYGIVFLFDYHDISFYQKHGKGYSVDGIWGSQPP